MKINLVKQSDKQKHIILSFLICAGLFIFIRNIFACAFISLFIGILKELIYDGVMRKGCEDIEDVYADTLGCIIFLAIFSIF